MKTVDKRNEVPKASSTYEKFLRYSVSSFSVNTKGTNIFHVSIQGSPIAEEIINLLELQGTK